MLLLFTTSAQTHIFPEVRIDAVRLLDIFLEYVPQLVISGWREDGKGNGSRVLEGYLGILNAGTRFGETDGKLSFVHWLQTLKIFIRTLEGDLNSKRGSNSCRKGIYQTGLFILIEFFSQNLLFFDLCRHS